MDEKINEIEKLYGKGKNHHIETLISYVKDLEGAITGWRIVEMVDKKRIKELVGGIGRIVEGKGAYSMDRLKHAENTIEDMKEIARKLIENEKAVSYFTCKRCGQRVEYDNDRCSLPKDLLCEECYLEAHDSIGD